MRCYYSLVNFIPTEIPRPDQLGNLRRCNFSKVDPPPLPTTPGGLVDTPAMRNKGNVLQYKVNQNPLSKKMIYARKVRGEWTNNKRTYATQTQKIASPNTESLLRIGGTLISVGGDPTSTNTVCIYNPDTFPANQPSEVIDIPAYIYPDPPINLIVPPEEEGPITAGPFDPPVVPPEEPVNYVAPSGGVLVCSAVVIPTCDTSVAGQTIINQTYDQMCYTADHSNVPGQSVLCWDEGTQTWYAKAGPTAEP